MVFYGISVMKYVRSRNNDHLPEIASRNLCLLEECAPYKAVEKPLESTTCSDKLVLDVFATVGS